MWIRDPRRCRTRARSERESATARCARRFDPMFPLLRDEPDAGSPASSARPTSDSNGETEGCPVVLLGRTGGSGSECRASTSDPRPPAPMLVTEMEVDDGRVDDGHTKALRSTRLPHLAGSQLLLGPPVQGIGVIEQRWQEQQRPYPDSMPWQVAQPVGGAVKLVRGTSGSIRDAGSTGLRRESVLRVRRQHPRCWRSLRRQRDSRGARMR